MIFWIVAGALALISSSLLALALLRRQDHQEHPAAYDLRVYRDQLKEVDRDLARGVIADADAHRLRTEVSRRILAADTQLQADQDPDSGRGPASVVLAVVLGCVLLGGSFFIYAQLGAPGQLDSPLKLRFELAQEAKDNRMDQATAEANVPPQVATSPDPQFADLMVKLRTAVAQNPDDLEGQQLLARNESSLGNLNAAYIAQANVIRLSGDQSTAGDFNIHANLLIAAAAGYVSPEAENSLRQALEIDPLNNLARYYWGLMLMQNGRPDAAFRIWDQVLRQSPPDAPWVAPIRERIADLGWFAGVEYELPAPAPHSGDLSGPSADGLSGPSTDDVQAAGEMSAQDRQEMIVSMVAQLGERLATEGGTPQEWARLISAHGVLGDTDRAALIWAEAQQVFGQVPEALAIVQAGARRAGVSQ